jgi:L-threonylcarbamoyladenylate synthase
MPLERRFDLDDNRRYNHRRVGVAWSPPRLWTRPVVVMQTIETVRIRIQNPGALCQAVEALAQGQAIVFPTDTVYGLGAHALLPEAVTGLYVVKDRPKDLPIPLLLPDARAMLSVCASVPPMAWQMAERFWPGGLSLILPRSPAVPDAVTAGKPTVAVRVPNHPLVREMCYCLEAPLAATSANRHGEPAPVSADAAELALRGRIPLLLDGGRCPGGMASTIVDLSVAPPVIRRLGPVTADQLVAFVSQAGTRATQGE